MAGPGSLTLACQDTELNDTLAAVYGAHFAGRRLAIDPQRYSYDAVADMVDDGATRWDVCKTDATECALAGRAGLLAAIDYSVVDRTAAPAAFTVPWWGVPCYLYSYVLAYDTAAFGGAVPTGWAALWDRTSFPGKRILPSGSVGGVCEAALMGAGVPGAHLYPLDMDRALARLRLLGDVLLFAADEPQAAAMLAQGAASLALIRSTTAQALRASTGGHIDYIWNQAILAPSVLSVPKAAPAGTDAMRFIAASQDAAVQTELLRRAGCGPVNPAVAAGLPPDLAAINPASAAHRAVGVAMDAAWYLINLRALQPRWAGFVAAPPLAAAAPVAAAPVAAAPVAKAR